MARRHGALGLMRDHLLGEFLGLDLGALLALHPIALLERVEHGVAAARGTDVFLNDVELVDGDVNLVGAGIFESKEVARNVH